jgi:hypothetical protein
VPTVAYFYGIAISMYWRDHNPPHFHARYGEHHAMVRIADCEVFSGNLPRSARNMVREWALARRPELTENWRRGLAREPLERIVGPDDED